MMYRALAIVALLASTAQAAEYRWNLQDNAANATVAGTITAALNTGFTSTITTTGPGGDFPAAFNLQGTYYATLTSDSTLNSMSSAMTVAWWMYGVDYTTSATEQFAGCVCKKGAAAGDTWAITLNSGTSLRFRQNGTTQATSGTIAGTGAWHHYAMVYNGTTVQFYQDGATLGSATTVTLDVTNTQNIYIGYEQDNGRNIKARMAGVYISDTALDGAAISALYAEGSDAAAIDPLSTSIPGSSADPLTGTIPGL